MRVFISFAASIRVDFICVPNDGQAPLLGFYRILGVLWSKKISFSMPEARSLCDPAEVAHLQLECRQF